LGIHFAILISAFCLSTEVALANFFLSGNNLCKLELAFAIHPESTGAYFFQYIFIDFR